MLPSQHLVTSSDSKSFIKPDAYIAGKPYLDMDALIEQAQSISKDLGDQVNKLVVNLNGTVANNKAGIDSIVKNLELTSKNFEEFSGDLKKNPWKLLYKQKEK